MALPWTTGTSSHPARLTTLWPLIEEGTLAIPRGGYLLRRGRGRIIGERARS